MARNKGPEWERSLSREMSYWFTGSHEELVVYRSAGSGSVSTNAIKRGKKADESGDLRPLGNCPFPHFFDKIHVDAKSMKEVDLWIHATNLKSNRLYTEWLKVMDDARKSSKHPMMVVQWRVKRKKFVVLGPWLYERVKSRARLHCLHYMFPTEQKFFVFEWADFLTSCRPEDLLVL
jgi:hypothetical protein